MKVQFTAPNGTLVTVEGSGEDAARLISRVLGTQVQAPKRILYPEAIREAHNRFCLENLPRGKALALERGKAPRYTSGIKKYWGAFVGWSTQDFIALVNHLEEEGHLKPTQVGCDASAWTFVCAEHRKFEERYSK